MKKLVGTFFGYLLLCSTSFASGLIANQEIIWQGNTIGFHTQDSNVEFIRPSHWEIVKDKTFMEKISTSKFALNLVFRPAYDSTIDYVIEQKKLFENKIFLPLPSRLEHAELFLNDFIGSTQYEIVPSLMNQSPFLYFKVLINDDQLSTLKKLAQNGIAFVGNIEYSFLRNQDQITSSAAIKGIIAPRDLTFDRPESFGLEWLVDLFTNYETYLQGAADGKYSLGFVSVSIENSILSLNIDPTATSFAKEGNTVQIRPKSSNAYGRISFYIPELGAQIEMNVRYSITGSLNVSNANVTLSSLRLDKIETVEGNADPFTLKALNKYLAQPETLKKISKSIEENLKSRILDGSLFF